MVRSSLSLLFTALVLFASSASAKLVQPPLTALRAPGNNIVSATVLALETDPAALSVQVHETLLGRPRTEFRILVDANLLPYVETGGRYLLIYNDLERVEGKPGVFVQTEHGKLQVFDGAEPAIFRDTPQLRGLLDPAHAQVEGRAEYKSEVLAGLVQEDLQLSNLWAGELALRAEVVEALTAADIAAIARFVDDPDGHPSGRARLLRTAREFAPQLGQDWYFESARKLVGTLPVTGDQGLFEQAGLAFVVFETVRLDSRAVPVADLTRWLRSPQPALAEHALLKLRAQAPELEVQAIEAALAEHLLPAGTRAFLVDHLRRLRLQSSAP